MSPVPSSTSGPAPHAAGFACRIGEPHPAAAPELATWRCRLRVRQCRRGRREARPAGCRRHPVVTVTAPMRRCLALLLAQYLGMALAQARASGSGQRRDRTRAYAQTAAAAAGDAPSKPDCPLAAPPDNADPGSALPDRADASPLCFRRRWAGDIMPLGAGSARSARHPAPELNLAYLQVPYRRWWSSGEPGC